MSKQSKRYLIATIFIIFILTGCKTEEPKTKEESSRSIDNNLGPIVFESDRDGDSEIYLMDIEGGNVVQLTHNTATDSDPSWSPDGKKIVFTSNRDGNENVYIMDANGKNQRELTKYRLSDYGPSWSPDGKRIAYTSYRHKNIDIYIMDADGKNSRRLTYSPGEDSSPSWSSDGKKIVFESMREGYSEIYTMDNEGENIKRLTHNNVMDIEPSWSPDGKTIAFTSQREGDIVSKIYLMGIDGKNQGRLTSKEDYTDFSLSENYCESNPSWSPDGRKIVYTFGSKETGNFEIYIINIETKEIKRLTYNKIVDSFPSWRPSP